MPDRQVSSIDRIDWKTLQQEGIRVLLFDVDQTLVDSGTSDVSERQLALFSFLKETGLTPVLVTNNFSPRIQRLSRQDGLPAIYMMAGKPFGFVFRRIARRYQVNPDEMMMIGDQLLSDILGGNRFGCHTVLVSDKKGNLRPDQKITERIDRWILERLKEIS